MPPFNPYLTQQQMMNNSNTQEMALQRQIENAQNQLQQIQAQRQMMAQQMAAMNTMPAQQPIVQPHGIPTQIVESFDSISVDAIPTDNNGAIFVKKDGSEIQSRRWLGDGRMQITSYLPQQATENAQAENSALMGENSKIALSDELTGAFMQRFDDLAMRLEKIEQNFAPKTSGRSKKEVESE